MMYSEEELHNAPALRGLAYKLLVMRLRGLGFWKHIRRLVVANELAELHVTDLPGAESAVCRTR